ncbi:hypothetical protein BG015_000871 [Linnemannia schmuckeri]|uniref:Ankyrin n=1 Tax=Linnemannia schmuckeri TaxID=64567 RepID=A0A9P5S3U7_9FUNG|nr:hypothetical protein BG015_000871 [Linnemannia schmuckeri]
MRGSTKGPKDSEDYEDSFLHQTIGGSRIRSYSQRHGQHRLNRHHHPSVTPTGTSSTSYNTQTSSAGAAGATASSVSSYLENLPSITLDNTTPPPRPPRPPGGLLGISNGRGMGYGRSLGSSYDSPLTTHGSFNGHVRSGVNLYGAKNPSSSGFSSSKSSGNHHRPSMSVFPIQKALEIAMKESRLLAAASSRGGSGTSGTGMSTGITFVRELRKARHARGAIITEHGPTPDISLDEAEEGDMHMDNGVSHSSSKNATGTRTKAAEQQADDVMSEFETRTTARFFSLSTGSHSSSSTQPEAGDIRIQRPAVIALDAKGAYPGIAHLPHSLTAQSGAVALHYPRALRNVVLPSRPWQPSSESYAALASTTIPTIHSSASSSNIGAQDSLFISSSTSSSSSISTSYQPHFSPVFSSSSSSSTFSSAPIWSSKSSINASKSSSSNSAVHAVRELLDSYPAPSPYCVDDKKRSPLHFAAASGDLELVEFLLERGVRPDCGRDIAGNMPLHLAIISNRIDVVAALLKAGADMTLASPMTHKTPLDLAESRLSYLLSRAQDTARYPSESMDLHTSHSNNQIATRSSFYTPPAQSPALLYQIKGIVNLLRPYVVRQQRLQHGERQKERQKERSWDRADKYMRQHPSQDGSSGSSSGLWQSDPHSEAHYGDMEDDDEDDDDDDDDDDMDTGEGGRRPLRKKLPLFRQEADMDEDDELPSYSAKPKKLGRRLNRRMDADETEVALESLMNGLSLLEATRKQQEQRQLQQQQQQQLIQDGSGNGGMSLGATSALGGVSEIGDGNLADSELDPRSEQDVDEALPDLLEQVQQVLQAIKLNENKGT